MGAVDSRHLLVVGAGPGLGASVARRFAREGYRLTLVARSQATTAALADELRGAGTDVTVVEADAGDPNRLRAAVAPLFARPGAPGVVIYSAALAAPDDLLSVTREHLAAATMLARTLRDDNIHAGSLTILGQIAAGTPLDPDRIADAYWAIRNENPGAWREEYRFDGGAPGLSAPPPASSS